MKVMGTGPIPLNSLTVWKLPSCLPYAFLLTFISIVSRCPPSSIIRPAQVPNTGMPERIASRTGSNKASSLMIRIIAVLSPPGITRPDIPTPSPPTGRNLFQSSRFLISTVSAPRRWSNC